MEGLTPKDRAVLVSSSLLTGVGDDALDAVLEVAHPVDALEGTIVIKENLFSEDLYVVLSGSLNVSLDNAGAGFLVASVGPGECVGEFCLLDDKNRRCSATVRTANRARYLRIGKRALLQVFESNPGVGYAIMGNLARLLIRRLEKTNDLARSLVASDRT
jgi:CRP-like cAMP-binding protein